MQYILKAYRAYFKILFALSPEIAAQQAFKLFSTPRMKKMKAIEAQVLNKAQTGAVFVNGLLVRTYKWKGGIKKALLVHGWEGNGGSLGYFVQPLLDAGYTVVSFDGPAHFNSTARQTNLLDFSEVISELISRERPEVILSHSFGSASSVVALHRNPMLTSVKHLVLMGSPNKFVDVIKEFAGMMHFSPKQTDYLIQYLGRKFNKNMEDISVESYLNDIAANVLVVHDSHDRIIPYQCAVSIAAENPGTTLFTVEKTGHYKMLWKEQILQKVMDFISTGNQLTVQEDYQFILAQKQREMLKAI